jgi:hypothetical protein
MGPVEFFNKSKRTLGGNKMDTLDVGKQNILTTLQDARGGLDNISCLNELYSTPSCSEQTTEFTAAENPYTKTPWSLELEVQGKC